MNILKTKVRQKRNAKSLRERARLVPNNKGSEKAMKCRYNYKLNEGETLFSRRIYGIR